MDTFANSLNAYKDLLKQLADNSKEQGRWIVENREYIEALRNRISKLELVVEKLIRKE